MRLVILFDVFLNLADNFAKVARTKASKSKLYTKKALKSLGIGSIFEQ